MEGILQRSTLRRITSGVFQAPTSLICASSSRVALTSQRRHISIQQLDHEKKDRERVVILGSGWAGFTVSRRLDPKKFQAIVVSPRSYFVFTPLLASTSVGTLEFRTALEPIRSRRSQVNFFQGWADNVDYAGKKLTVEVAEDDEVPGLASTGGEEKDPKDLAVTPRKGMFEMSYDKLVISVGCYSQTFGTPGVRENALFLKDVADARKIRKRLLACFETAACPTTSEELKKNLLNFAIVGGGPTGVEFAAELHDLIHEDMTKMYPDLIKYTNITVYDVADTVLSMFDERLAKYAMDTFKREGISIQTSHHVEELRKGAPSSSSEAGNEACFTLKTKEDGEIGVGMVVWSTGLMINPFVEKETKVIQALPRNRVQYTNVDQRAARQLDWTVKKDARTGSLVTDEHLRLIMEPQGAEGEGSPRAVVQDVYALGDCAVLEGTNFPATAQVASQKAAWLGKRLNKGDVDEKAFKFTNWGTMAYIGSWRAVLQPGSGGQVSGFTAWLVWRGAYLTKAVSWRNKILIPTYWFLNWVFGRDISRF